MSRNQRITLTVLAVLVAGIVGVAVAMVVTKSDNEGKRADTVVVTATAREQTASEQATQSATDITANTTASTTTTTTSSTTRQTTATKGFDEAVAAGRNYGFRHFSASSFKSETVVLSKSDPNYGIVSFFEGKTPIAVWVKKQDGKWIGIAGTKTSQPAPVGMGIPDDIKFPFSESGGVRP